MNDCRRHIKNHWELKKNAENYMERNISKIFGIFKIDIFFFKVYDWKGLLFAQILKALF